MILDLLMLVMMAMKLAIIYAVSIYHIRKNFETGQSVEVEFKLDGVLPAGIYGNALVLINRLVSISSDGQRMFELT